MRSFNQKNVLRGIYSKSLNSFFWLNQLSTKCVKCGESEKVTLDIISVLRQLKNTGEVSALLFYEAFEIIRPQIVLK